MKMKMNFLAVILLALIVPCARAQSLSVDMTRLKAEFAQRVGIAVSDIRSAEVLTFGDQHFAYVKYTKEGRPNTTATGLQIGGPGDYISGSFEITCTGVGCTECDIEGLPNPKDVHCACARSAMQGAYCNQTKSIKIGG